MEERGPSAQPTHPQDQLKSSNPGSIPLSYCMILAVNNLGLHSAGAQWEKE